MTPASTLALSLSTAHRMVDWIHAHTPDVGPAPQPAFPPGLLSLPLLIEAWASMTSLKPKDPRADQPPASGGGRDAERDFHGERRRNDTHASTTDPDARLYRKGRGKEAKLCL